MNAPKMERLAAGVLLIAVVLGGCASMQTQRPTQPVPDLAHPKSSGLAIDVSLKPPLSLFGNPRPDQIYFANIDVEGGLLQQQVIGSNYSKDGRVYLLNARPGVYVAVAAFYSVSSPPTGAQSYTTYFPNELVEQTRVAVQEGDFVFIGKYVVDLSVGLKGADRVQIHYRDVIARRATPGGVFYVTDGYHYRGAPLERKIDEQTRTEFGRKAKEDLAGSGWPTRIW